MSDPRKYGHGDKGVESFIKNLAANLSDKSKLEQINTECLSITYENMRPALLKELFERIGARDVWKSIGEQAPVKVLYETSDSGHARSEAESALNKFMDVRNTIAHPSAGITWPEMPVVEGYITYFEVIAKALSEVVQVYTVTLPRMVNNKPQAKESVRQVAQSVTVTEEKCELSTVEIKTTAEAVQPLTVGETRE